MMPAETKILLFKRNLKNWIEKLRGLPPIIRTGILAAASFLILLVLYLMVIEPLLNLGEEWSRQLSQKEQELTRYQALLANKDDIASHLEALQTMLNKANELLLTGSSAALAAADLQEILKNLLKTCGAQSLAIKILPPKERGLYLEVPILVQLSGNIEQLLNILYQLEHNEKFLVVTDLDINVTRSEGVKEVMPKFRADLIVAGMIKKGIGS